MRARTRAGGEGPAAALPGYRTVHRLAGLTAALMALASGAGLLAPGLYRDNELVTAAWLGNDAVTLLVAVPLTALAVPRSSAGSRRWRLAMLGLLLYAAYAYGFYLFGAAFNALFPVYVALTAAAGYGLLLGLAALDVDAVAAGFRSGVHDRVVAAFVLGVSLLLGGFWVAQSAAFLLTGSPPAMVEATGHPTNVTGALDLTVVVVLGAVAGAWLWRGRPWGRVLAVIWSVKGALYMLALSAAAVSAWRIGPADDVVQVALWAPIGVGSALSAWALLRGYGGAEGGMSGGPATASVRPEGPDGS